MLVCRVWRKAWVGCSEPEEEKFQIMLMGLAGIEDHGAKAATAMEVFGRAGTGMLPMLTEGAEGLKELMGRAAELGVEFDQVSADKAARFTDSLTLLKGSMQGVMLEIGEQLAPHLATLATKVSEVIAKVSAWMEENPKLARILVIVVGAIGAVLAVLGPLLIMLPGIVIAIKAVVAAFAILTGPIGLAIAAVVAFALAWKNNFLGIQDITKKIFEAVAGFIGKAIDWIIDKINAMIKAVNEVGKFFNIEIPTLDEMGDTILKLGSKIKDVASDFLGLGKASNKATDEIEKDASKLNTLAALPPTMGVVGGTGFATPNVVGGVTTGKGFLEGMSENMINAFYKSAAGKAALAGSYFKVHQGIKFIGGASGLSPEEVNQGLTNINLNIEVDNLGDAITSYIGNEFDEEGQLVNG